jgi:hypothetical protein
VGGWGPLCPEGTRVVIFRWNFLKFELGEGSVLSVTIVALGEVHIFNNSSSGVLSTFGVVRLVGR